MDKLNFFLLGMIVGMYIFIIPKFIYKIIKKRLVNKICELQGYFIEIKYGKKTFYSLEDFEKYKKGEKK